jgi:hypothetical protein
VDVDAKGASSLQFDTAVTRAGIESGQAVTCSACGEAIADQYFDAAGKPFCAACRDGIAAAMQVPQGWGVLVCAGLFGLGAAIAGAALYYAVVAITNFEIGIVAIAIGYMVGYAIRFGARGRGGRRFQVMAVLLTYWAVGLAYAPIAFQGAAAADDKATALAVAGGNDVLPAEPEAEGASGAGSPVLAMAIVLAFTVALPILVIVTSLPGGLISAAIIAFGMQQAWRMTALPHIEITGPYRIGSPPIAPA